MKQKIITIIIILSLFGAISGCTFLKSTNNSSNIEKITIETPHTHATTDEVAVEKVKSLTDDDKSVKAEIAKFIDTKADFKHKKLEKIGEKSIELFFCELDKSSKYEKVIYKNELGDEFKYDTASGKLVIAQIDSAKTEKTSQSIDKMMAQKIASDYVSNNCDIDQYTLTVCEESGDGYTFWYERYIGGYEASDAFRIKIGFDGAIIYFNNSTDVFIGKNIDYSKQFIDDKINAYLADKNNATINSVVIGEYDGKICANCSYSFTLESGAKTSQIAIIPIE